MTIILNENNELDTELENNTKQYMDYLEKHITGVIKAFDIYFKPLLTDTTIAVGDYSNEDFRKAIENKAKSIDKHDLSKYNDLEFYPYRRHYYPTTEEKNEDDDQQRIAEEKYEAAWKHHYEHNSHHIEYWYDWKNSIPIDMPLEDIIEMLCDWISMSYIFNNPIDKWWKEQKDCLDERSMMTPETINIVNQIYDIITK